MASTISLQKKPSIKDPVWDKTAAVPGDSLELSVTAENADTLKVAFEITNDKGEALGVLLADDATRKATWTAPMIGDTSVGGVVYTFEAFLRGKPTPANGHTGIIQRLKSTNTVTIKGTRIKDLDPDVVFVPKHEKLELAFNVEGVAPAKGLIEIWGERYPTDKPIYTEKFVPVLGANTWDKWYGGKHPKTTDVAGTITEDGPLKDKYLSPEFSPYRIRVLAGPDDASLEDPLGVGLGKVSTAETQFEVKFESLQMRIGLGLTEKIKHTDANRRFRLEHVLMTGDRNVNGSYPARARLPCLAIWQATFWVAADGDCDFDLTKINKHLKFVKGANEIAVWLNDTQLTLNTNYTEEGTAGEPVSKIKLSAALSHESDTLFVARVDQASIAAGQNARIRIPMGLHQRTTDNLGQGGLNIADAYLAAGDTKFTIDSGVYSRPELPIEIVPLLTSKTASKNAAPYFGVFEAEAVGPLKVEPVAEDFYLDSIYQGGVAQHRRYFRNVHNKIKKGAHNAPARNGAAPVFYYWQWRKALTANITADTDQVMTGIDATLQYKVGSDQLTVWLNRAKLVKEVDYKEVGANDSMSGTIKLKAGVGKNLDVLWVVRADATAAGGDAVAGWTIYPPGTNCHRHYGGLRGKNAATPADRLFLKSFSADRGGAFDSIIGKSLNGKFPFRQKKYINLTPDPLDNAADQERVELTTQLTGDKQGLAGVIFSPSFIAGDSYVLKARIDSLSYERNFGEVGRKPVLEAKTGTMTNWRWCQIGKSLRCPTTGGGYTLRSNVGSPAEPALNTRAYKGIGVNVNLDVMNATLLPEAYCEWTVPLPIPITAATNVTPIEITTSVPHGLATGEHVSIVGVKGNTNANGADLTITKVSDTKFTINSVAGNGAYVSGGLMEPLEMHKDLDLEEYVDAHDTAANGVGGAGMVLIRNLREMPIRTASNATPIVITLSTPHRFETGDRVKIAGLTGNTGGNGVHVITVVDAISFSLNGSVGNGDRAAGWAGVKLVDFPAPATMTGATDKRPIVVTAAGHGLATGDVVVISGVVGNTAANGTRTITRVNDDKFSLDGIKGNGAFGGFFKRVRTPGTGTVQLSNIIVTAATDANPVEITTMANHGLHNRERVTIAGVGGNAAANGNHTITKVSDTKFTLDGVKGNAAYTSGGTVRTRDFHHRNITDWIAQYDPYRLKLPVTLDLSTGRVPLPANRANVASMVIQNATAPGDRWSDVSDAIQDRITSWDLANGGAGGADRAFTTPIPASATTDGDGDYFWFGFNRWSRIAAGVVNHFTPVDASPKFVNLIRWKSLHDPSYDIIWEGQSLGSAQALIHSGRISTTLYSHEMGHAMHLVHFLAGNFGWKHHDLSFPECMMSYGHETHRITKPGGAVGPNGTSLENGGWPHRIGTTPNYSKNYPTLNSRGVALSKPCARCMLKLMGWNEEVLPAAWTHPDLF